MTDRTELRVAIKARDDVVVVLDEDREWEFPGDIGSDAFLTFIEEHGDEIAAGGNLSLPATRSFFVAVLGANFADIRQRTTFRELNALAWRLYYHHMGIDGEGEDDDPPAETVSPS